MTPQKLGRRARARAEMEAAILATGRRQLAARGAAALSLREVARSIGVASSAVYRYVESRDALLTLLVADAYTQLAVAVEAALEHIEERDGGRRLAVLAFAMREWARSHPEQWGLIYGAPVPGYEAPSEATSAPGTRVMSQILAIARTADPGDVPSPPELRDYLLTGSADLGQAAAPSAALFAVRAWCTIVGTISMEIFGQLGPEPRSNPSLGHAILASQIDELSRHLQGSQS